MWTLTISVSAIRNKAIRNYKSIIYIEMRKMKSTLSVGKRIILLSVCMAMFSVTGFSQGAKGKKVKGAPVFSQVVYQGNDQVYRRR